MARVTALDPRLLLQGYAMGIFPMADSRDADEVFWVEPRSRAILPLDGFHLSHSLRRTLRSDKFAVTADRAFADVIAACADRDETWINSDIERAVLSLYRLGHAHSVEVWKDDALAGGLYGVSLGRAFFGESMFSRETDASKVALACLVARLNAGGYELLDCQFMTGHLASLGAIAVPRDRYVALLATALGEGASGAGEGAGASAAGAAWSPADFGAVDSLLEEEGAAPGGGGGPGGKLIAQLLGHTS
jgi:leucyl/phenylalanyl-tRNA--protein transferase